MTSEQDAFLTRVQNGIEDLEGLRRGVEFAACQRQAVNAGPGFFA